MHAGWVLYSLTRRRRLYATVTFHPSRELHRKIIDTYTEEVEGVKAISNLTTSVVFQALHNNAIKAMNQRGGNALGIESDGPLLSKSQNSKIFVAGFHALTNLHIHSCTLDVGMGKIRRRQCHVRLCPDVD